MSLRINQNIDALNSYRNLSVTQGQMSKSLEKLSSGFRINRAADDAAGLAISEGLRSQVGGLKVAVRNAQDGISVVQTAEGALTETHSILQRMRDLSVQASNTGGLSDDAKGNIQSELDELNKELTRIADSTSFNGTKLLDGNYTGTFQVGANVGETITVTQNKGVSAAALGLDDIAVAGNDASKTFGAVALGAGTGATNVVHDAVSISVGGTAYQVRAAGASGAGVAAMTTADIAAAINNNATAQTDGVSASVDGGNLVISKSGVTGALGTVTFTTPTTSGTGTGTAAAFSNTTEDTTKAVDGSAADPAAALTAIDAAIKTVSTVRAELGAVQNRFDHTINNLNVAVENLSASESRIRDTDMAQEMMSFTRSQILSQAGTAMLAQANQVPQGVLSLLR